jgi:hypothetical protein
MKQRVNRTEVPMAGLVKLSQILLQQSIRMLGALRTPHGKGFWELERAEETDKYNKSHAQSKKTDRMRT